MNQYLKMFLVSAPIHITLDALWLASTFKHFYYPAIGHLMRMNNGILTPYLPPVILLYPLMVVGLVFFVLAHTVSLPLGLYTFAYGAFYGLIGYAIYDLTNYALLNEWPLIVVIVDVAWGTLLFGTTSFIATFLLQRMN